MRDEEQLGSPRASCRQHVPSKKVVQGRRHLFLMLASVLPSRMHPF